MADRVTGMGGPPMRAALFSHQRSLRCAQGRLSGPQDARCLRSIHHMRRIIDAMPHQQRDVFAGEGMLAVVRFLIPDIVAEVSIIE